MSRNWVRIITGLIGVVLMGAFRVRIALDSERKGAAGRTLGMKAQLVAGLKFVLFRITIAHAVIIAGIGL